MKFRQHTNCVLVYYFCKQMWIWPIWTTFYHKFKQPGAHCTARGQYRKANYVFPDFSWYQYVQILQDHLLGKELKVELLSLKGPWYLLLITATITNNHMSHSQQRVQCQLWSAGLLLGKCEHQARTLITGSSHSSMSRDWMGSPQSFQLSWKLKIKFLHAKVRKNRIQF